jgi:NCS1 family nucleobase:cation symporter-1
MLAVLGTYRLANAATIFLAVLGSSSVFLDPMTGLMISSYFVVNKCRINIDDLYVGNGASIYW